MTSVRQNQERSCRKKCFNDTLCDIPLNEWMNESMKALCPYLSFVFFSSWFFLDRFFIAIFSFLPKSGCNWNTTTNLGFKLIQSVTPKRFPEFFGGVFSHSNKSWMRNLNSAQYKTFQSFRQIILALAEETPQPRGLTLATAAGMCDLGPAALRARRVSSCRGKGLCSPQSLDSCLSHGQFGKRSATVRASLRPEDPTALGGR